MKIGIFYASATGGNLELALFLAGILKQNHSVTVKPIAKVNGADLNHYDLIIINPRTDGAGELAPEELALYHHLETIQRPHFQYWVTGIGDRGFGADFAQAVTIFDKQLARIGSHRLNLPLKIDYQLDSTAKKQIQQILTSLLKE